MRMADTLFTMAVLIPLLLAVLLSSAASKANETTTEPPVLIIDEVAQVSDFHESNPSMVNGNRVHEGDMVLTDEQWQSLMQRKAIINTNYRWPKDANGFPRVPYRFTDSQLDNATINSAIAHWEDNTCLRFDATTNTSQPHLRFIKGVGCYSFVGRITSMNGQDISIGNGCNTLGIVAHEIGHAIGFLHEQSRTDRDTYVSIHPDSIRNTSLRNFEIRSGSSNYSVPYDLSSDLHYGTKYFTTNGKPTITTIDPLKSHLIGKRDGLTFRDIKLANIIYDCIGMWNASCSSPPTCQNEGYVGADCKCVCPPGTSGATCENVIGGYYDDLHDGCTESITNEGVVTSPGYPNKSPSGLRCAKVLEAPACMLPQLTFTNFSLYQRTTHCNPACCRIDSLEVRMNHPNVSDLYCDTDIAPGRTFTGTSRTLVLYYYTNKNYSKWSANFTFVPDSTCTTTTTTSTTSTTPVATTTPTCKVELINGIYYWSSPSFDGTTHYPNNFVCGITGSSSRSMVTIRVVSFSLENQTYCNYDNVSLDHLYSRNETWCGIQTGMLFRGPSFNFKMKFKTDFSVTVPGFNISIAPGPWPPYNCHKVIHMVAGKIYTLPTPNFWLTRRMTSRFFCEYRFVAPADKKVRVMALITSMSDSPLCMEEFMLLNGNKQRQYPAATSKIFCDSKIRWNVMTTTTNALYVAYQKDYNRSSRGFWIIVRAV